MKNQQAFTCWPSINELFIATVYLVVSKTYDLHVSLQIAPDAQNKHALKGLGYATVSPKNQIHYLGKSSQLPSQWRFWNIFIKQWKNEIATQITRHGFLAKPFLFVDCLKFGAALRLHRVLMSLRIKASEALLAHVVRCIRIMLLYVVVQFSFAQTWVLVTTKPQAWSQMRGVCQRPNPNNWSNRRPEN